MLTTGMNSNAPVFLGLQKPLVEPQDYKPPTLRDMPLADGRDVRAVMNFGHPPAMFWRAARGEPDPLLHEAPPSIVQLKITQVLDAQAAAHGERLAQERATRMLDARSELAEQLRDAVAGRTLAALNAEQAKAPLPLDGHQQTPPEPEPEPTLPVFRAYDETARLARGSQNEAPMASRPVPDSGAGPPPEPQSIVTQSSAKSSIAAAAYQETTLLAAVSRDASREFAGAIAFHRPALAL